MGVSRGYSILEVMVVLSLSAVLLGVSFPAFNMLAQLHIREDAWKTVSVALRAKNLSILEGGNYFVLFQPHSLTIVTETGKAVSRHRIRASAQLNGSENFKINLFSGGVATPATILLALRGKSCKVIITLRGRARSTC